MYICQCHIMFFFLMIRRPPRFTPLYSSAASDVYKRQIHGGVRDPPLMGAPSLVGVGGAGEQVGVDVIGQALAPGQHVKTLGIHVLEEGWSPALFEHMAAHGLDVLTWRKGL